MNIVVGEVEAEAKPVARRGSAPEAKPTPSAAGKSLGLTLADLTDAQKTELKVKGGVRIEAAEGAAARAGLREGDVILAVANTEVLTVRELESVIGKLDKNRPVSLLFRRGEWAQYAVIRPQAR